jgi:hypothetical protein
MRGCGDELITSVSKTYGSGLAAAGGVTASCGLSSRGERSVARMRDDEVLSRCGKNSLKVAAKTFQTFQTSLQLLNPASYPFGNDDTVAQTHRGLACVLRYPEQPW